MPEIAVARLKHSPTGTHCCHAMRTLRTIFGPQIPEPIDFQITRWHPIHSHSEPIRTTRLEFIPALAMNSPNRSRIACFFAGEATDPIISPPPTAPTSPASAPLKRSPVSGKAPASGSVVECLF